MIRIYIQNKPLLLIDKVTPEIEDYINKPDTIFIQQLNTFSVVKMLREMERGTIRAGVFQHQNVSDLLNAFKSNLTPIQAAGGFVYTKDGEALLIFRKGKWDLPKGKLDEGETLEDCAIREITEETGVNGMRIISPLQATYHTYYEREKHILKESHWYLMEKEESSPLVPQTEEDIEKCEWVLLENISTYKANMHASIIDVVHEAEKALKFDN
jgi:8-oxo-dGTP pyrophosphatase MutT (NUDIX family)